MKRSLGPKTIAYPHPVFLVGTYDARERPNLMAAAWGGICCSRPPSVAVSLRPATYTHGCILQRQAFTLGVPSRSQVEQADHVGIVSGRDHDKFAATGWTPVRSELVDAPYARELPLVLECRLAQVVEVGLHTQFIGEILDVKADETVLNAEGLPDILKVDPLIFSTGDRAYFGLGDRVASAFTAREPISKA